MIIKKKLKKSVALLQTAFNRNDFFGGNKNV